ncbi:hypothetical protein F4774DRAFT_401205 [Daldinia eschscholtzii]|nr:hypothetical protein F4774DRAFT_401205 [Daldinia eschscholtzii]
MLSFLSGSSEPTTAWNLTYVGLVAYLGQAATESHIHIMPRSPLRLLPRIIPGPQILTSTFKSFRVKYEWELDASGTLSGFPAYASNLNGSYTRANIDLIKEFMNSPENNIPLSLNIWRVNFYSRDRAYVGDKSPTDEVNRATSKSTLWNGFWNKVQSYQNTDWMIVLSFCATCGLFFFAASMRDGPAVIALVMISLHSMICSMSLREQILLQIQIYNDVMFPTYERIPANLPTYDKLIVRTTKNAFWILECNYHTALALFGARARVEYVESRGRRPSWDRGYEAKVWRAVHPITSSILLLSFVFLANSTIFAQAAIASAYILVSVFFWAIPPSETSEYKTTKIFYPRCDNAHLPKEDLQSSEVEPSLARTLWYAIRITRSTGWVRGVKAVPETPGWDEWLREAELNMNNDTWPAEAEKRRLVDGDQHVYDLLAEQDASQERISEEEIVPVDESLW